MDDEQEFFDHLEEAIFHEIDKAMNESAGKIIQDLISQAGLTNISPEGLFEQKKGEVKQEIHQVKEKSLERIEKAFKSFENNKKRLLTAEELQHVSDDFHLFAEHLRVLNVAQDLSTITLQEALGISDFVLYCFYLVGHHLYDEEQQEEASNIFFFLTILSPFVKDYWLALGMAEKINERFENSLAAFSMASLIDINDPAPHLYSARCYLLAKDNKMALDELEKAKEIIELAKSHSQWYEELKSIEREIVMTKNVA